MNAAGGVGRETLQFWSPAPVTKWWNNIVTSKVFRIGWTWNSRPSFTSKVGFSIKGQVCENKCRSSLIFTAATANLRSERHMVEVINYNVSSYHWSSKQNRCFFCRQTFWGPRPCEGVVKPRIVHGPRGSETRQRRTRRSHGFSEVWKGILGIKKTVKVFTNDSHRHVWHITTITTVIALNWHVDGMNVITSEYYNVLSHYILCTHSMLAAVFIDTIIESYIWTKLSRFVQVLSWVLNSILQVDQYWWVQSSEA